MLEIILLFYIFIALVSFLLTKDFFHPSVIVSGMWSFLLFLYKFCNHPLWDLSNTFFMVLSLWVVPFVLMSLFISKLAWRSTFSYNKIRPFAPYRYRKYYPFAIIYSLLFAPAFFIYAKGFTIAATKAILIGKEPPPLINLLLYLNPLLTVFVYYGILNYKKIGKWKVIFLLTLLLFMTAFKGNKTSYLSLFIGTSFLLKSKKMLKIKYVIGSFIVLTGFLIWVSVGRADYDWEQDSSILNFLYIYFLSPLPSVDMILQHEWFLEAGAPMSATFSFFYKILNTFGLDFKIAQTSEWVYVPLPNNVFTTLRPFYVDGGYLWIAIMACVLGGIWGVIYVFQKRGSIVATLFYAAMVSSLCYQSFDDYFFRDLSVVIQYYFYSILVVRGFKFK